ncbi:ABC transporter permease [Jiulongibacter sediminis]|uniref:ABC transporter permease n=1 Tax=Jiulongibacter sediminis TaxID=1605367 RepID=A0A0P7BAB7_9BACT|nr:ABC transporter permease [Jiulongibacter sediminis]KPM47305.1 ABC transporter permease [Jiulongibacter sediminis]TBX22863.1 ABC transporter permease [Jiulongibacter sediminis]
MIKNYIKIAWRNMTRNRSFSFINVFGLAASMSVCLLIILVIQDQFAYDDFHENRDRIYRVHTTNGHGFLSASSALPLADELKREFDGIEAAVGLSKDFGGDLVYNEKYASGGGYFAGEDFFKVLDFPLAEGDEATALKEPYSIIISQKIADNLFPREDPIGKVVQFNERGLQANGLEEGNRETPYGLFTIKGVLATPKGKTHLPFELLASQSTMRSLAADSILNYSESDWNNVWTNYTYVLMKPNQSKENLQSALDQISGSTYTDPNSDQFQFKAAELSELTPSAGFIGNMTSLTLPMPVLWVLTALCLVVMFSACLNYTNLSVARALSRAKEVGVRKVSGANRRQIFGQFIVEAIGFALVSLVMAYGLLCLLQNSFTDLWLNQNFLKISLSQNVWTVGLFLIFSLLVGLVAGLLPAIYVSALNPIHIFKGFGQVRFLKRMSVRKGLMVVQFVVSLVFIISVYVLFAQSKHVFNFNYGFDKDNVVNVKILKEDNYDRFAQKLASNKYVSSFSAASVIPAEGRHMARQVKMLDSRGDSLQTSYFDIDKAVLEVWKIPLLAGEGLPLNPSDHSILVNEEFVKNAGYGSPAQAIGQGINFADDDNVQIVGVVKDFHYLLPNQHTENLMLRNRKSTFEYVTIRTSGIDNSEAIASLEADWKSVNPDSKFEYKWMDDQLLFMHRMLRDITSVIGFISLLAILISCLGLLGMAAYNAESRVKEMGIRLVLGSSVKQIIFILSKGFLKLLAVAAVIALPLAYFINNLWLQDFAERITLGPGILLAGVLSMALLSLSMVFSQSYRVAVRNPVESLRSE